MNLRQIANNATHLINPNIEAKIYQSTGQSVNDDGSITPSYADPVDIMVQMQAVSQKDLQHVDNINLQGQFVSFWVNGNYYGINRKENEGGDIIVVEDQQWLVVSVPEVWYPWTHCVGCLQITDQIGSNEGLD